MVLAASPILAVAGKIQPLAARASAAIALASASALSELDARLGAVVAFADRFVSGVGSFFSAIDEIVFLRQPDLNQLALCELDQILVVRVPKAVVFETEILETVTNLVRVRHHFGRP